MKDFELKNILAGMTLEEKMLQVTQMPCAYVMQDGGELTGPAVENCGFTTNDFCRIGTILNARKRYPVKEIHKYFNLKNGSKVPIALMADVAHGFKTAYPMQIGLACSFDEEIAEDCARMAAKEAALMGISMTCSTMVDLARDPRWGRVAESFGEDPYLGQVMGRANVKGFQGDLGKYNVAACTKHFVGYGACEAGRDYNCVDMSETNLRNVYLPPFKATIDAGVELLMTAYNTLNGIPMTMHKALMVDVLRNEWGFEGVTISDYNACLEAITHGYCKDEKEVALRAFDCQVDIEMATTAYVKYLKELLEEGKISMAQLDEAVMRQLKLKNKLGLFENPNYSYSEEEQDKIYLCEEHRGIALKAAEESAVLLKNDGILPLNQELGTVALIGPHSNHGDLIGPWKAECLPEDTVTVLDGVKNCFGGRILQETACSWELDAIDDGGIAKAVEIAKEADTVILCLGEAPNDSGEGASKLHIDLPEIQYKLVDEITKVNKNTVAVLFTGRPLAIKRLSEKVRAILNMWWPGTEGGNATANLLFGKKSPCGRLSMSFPADVAQCPVYYNHFNTARPRPNDLKNWRFCSGYIDGPNKPLYSFGYGLSYSAVQYSAICLSANEFTSGEKITASVRVKNTGNFDVKETVQLYIRDEFGSVVRPVKELKGFKKVLLAAGEEKEVSFDINEEMLAFYGADMKFRAEKGSFIAYIGENSDTENGKKFKLI